MHVTVPQVLPTLQVPAAQSTMHISYTQAPAHQHSPLPQFNFDDLGDLDLNADDLDIGDPDDVGLYLLILILYLILVMFTS